MSNQSAIRTSTDYLHLVRELVTPLVERMSQHAETAGICILGGFALSGERPYADVYSDFDTALFLNLNVPDEILNLPPLQFQKAVQPFLPDWLPNFKFVYPYEHEALTQPLQINVHQLVIQYEQQPTIVWPFDRREAFGRTCDVMYDPQGIVKEVIKAKSPPPIAELKMRISTHLSVIPVTLEHTVDKCIQRDYNAAAFLGLCAMVELLIDFVYAINYRDTPHRKWRVPLLAKVATAPKDFYARIDRILTAESNSQRAMNEKVSELRALFAETSALIPEELKPDHEPYTALVSEQLPGYQLASQTRADKKVSPKDQYEKMKLAEWNISNFELAE